MLTRMLVTAVTAGALAGCLAAVLHVLLVQDLIVTAETYESGAAVHFAGAAEAAGRVQAPLEQAPPDQATPDQGGGAGTGQADVAASAAGARAAWTFAFGILLTTAYALMLTAGLAVAETLGRPVSALSGVVWGLAGFAAVHLAPSIGLPPALPGTDAAPMAARQGWWLLAVLSTATGAAVLGYGRGTLRFGLAAGLIALPHLVGAPVPETFSGVAPPELAAAFAARSLGVALVVWVTLGWVAGEVWARQSVTRGAVA